MATIKEVAQRAGVGVGTVSRVLNNASAVHPDTRSRVQRAIADLDYHPNHAARQLVTARTLTLGVVLPFLTRPFYVNVLQGIESAVATAHYHLNIFNVETAASRAYYFNDMPYRGRVDGLIIVSLPVEDTDIQRLEQQRVPTVLIDGFHPALPSVGMDNQAGMQQAVEYLVGCGHRRIGLISGPLDDELHFTVNHQRQAGYRAALQAHHLPHNPAFEQTGADSHAAGAVMCERLLDLPTPVTAVVATSDIHALGALQAAQARNVRVPEQLAIVGYDDIELATYVGLTTMRQPMAEMGRQGVQLLLHRLLQPKSAATHTTLVAALIQRQTA